MKSIEKLHRNKTEKVSDKWASYLSYYDTIFRPLQDTSISLLEIGVQNGGSLETWAQYFEKAKIIIGCDINERCRSLVYDDPRIKLVINNINSRNAFDEIVKYQPQFDIIIDDGSHISNDIINSFLIYFQILNPGGIYIIEDTHTLYMNNYGGGILNEAGGMNFFKKLADIPNYQFWHNDLSIPVYFRTFFQSDNLPVILKENWIESIEFRNSLIIIRKSLTPSNSKLGERLRVGEIQEVSREI